MSPHGSRFPPVSGSHPILAHCASVLEARQVEDLLRDAGLSCIRIDREAASLRVGHPVSEVAVILVSREDYARARALLSSSGLTAGGGGSPEPA